MGIELTNESLQVLVAFAVYLVGVAALGVVSHRFLTRGSFVKEYFLGNRGLGPWVLALTVAATAISGGTFMGFPSLVYSNGWVMALWICSYMVVPLTTMALMGKRLNQVARIAGSVTVPDVLRDRFQSPTLGLLSTALILFFLTVNLVAQFKAGGLVMQEALKLPPAAAEYTGAEVDAGRNLVLSFQVDGRVERQRTPLPFEDARVVEAKPVPPEGDPQGRPERVRVVFRSGETETVKFVRFPPQKVALPVLAEPVEKGYLIGLLIFAFTVIAYTTYGGFWAVTWTDVLEGLVMLVGVVIMAILAVRAVPPKTVERYAPAPAGTQGPVVVVKEELHGLAAATEALRQQDPHLVYGPGPKGYMPLGVAFSFFLMWSLMAAGQPSGMVRLMSFKDSASLRRALLLVGGYYIITYLSLVIIFICARAIFPTEYLRDVGSEGQPDSITPAMARHLAPPLVAGLLLAAPYAAIMSTVAAFLLMISSSLVRDLYQRTINPDVSPRAMKIGSYLVTGTVGIVVMLGALNPPAFLQDVIVFTGSSQGCCFLVPMFLTLYWRGATRAGVKAAMVGGFLTVFGLYALGWADSHSRELLQRHAQAVEQGSGTPPPEMLPTAQWLQENLSGLPGWGERRATGFAPLRVGGVDPLVWGLLVSGLLGLALSLITRRDPELVKKYFP